MTLAAAGYATLSSTRQQNIMTSHKTWLVHTYDVLLRLEEIDVALEELLASERGFIIKREAQYSKNFDASVASIDESIKALSALVADNPTQVQRVQFLARTLQRRTEYLRDAMTAARKDGFDSAAKFVNPRGQESAETQADDILHEIIDSEKGLLKQRSEKLKQETERNGELSSTLLALSASALFLCLLIVTYFFREKNNVARRLAIQLAVTQILSETKDVAQALPRLLEILGKINKFRYGGAWMLQGENDQKELQLASSWYDDDKPLPNFAKETDSRTFKLGEGLPGQIWSQGEPHFFDLQTVSDAKFPRKKSALEDGLRFGLGFPIFGQNELLGVIEFFADKMDVLDPEQVQTLAAFGQEIGHFVDASGAKKELVERAELSTFVAETAYVLSQQENLEEMLRQCTSLMSRHLGASLARIWIMSDEEDKSLHLKASSRSVKIPGGEQKTIHVGDCEIGIVAQKHRPLLTNDLQKTTEVKDKDWLNQEGLTAIAAYPLLFGKELMGVLAMYSDKNISRRTQETLAGVSNGIALGIKRSQSEHMLEEREHLFRTLTERIREVFIVAKPNNTFVYVSPAYEDIWGRPLDELYIDAQNIFKGIHPEDIQIVRDFSERILVTHEPQECEHRVLRPDGTIRWIWARTFPGFNEDGELETIYSIGHDITDRKESERRVSEFYSTVSHELRTPLTSIHASLRLIEGGLAGQVSDKVGRLVTIARHESDRLIRLINDILDIRKLEAGRLELKIREVSVVDLVSGALAATQGMAQEAKVNLKHQIMFNGSFKCDNDRVVQILTNFLSNAIKFSSEGQTVMLDVEKDKDNVRFSVTDSGQGIPESEMHKLWGKFQQLDSSDTRQKGGTGLGLAITKGLAEQHGGQVGVESTVGKGSTFWVELPVEKQNAKATQEMRSFALSRVLMIEDDQQLTRLVKSVLKKDGFDMEVAHTLEEADRILEQFIPRAIVLDVHLPDGNGLTWLKQKQSGEKPFEIPTVVLSGVEQNSELFGTAIIFDWLEKPVEDKKLERALRYAVRNKGVERAKVLIVESDPATRELIRHHVSSFPVDVIEASEGMKALRLVHTESPDLIILDVGIPAPEGFDIIQSLRSSDAKSTPLIVYTSLDLTKNDMENLTLGLTKHLIKSKTSEQELIDAVKVLLDGLVSTSPVESSAEK